MRTLIDTSAYIAASKGHQDVGNRMQDSTEIFLSPIVLGEILVGLRQSPRRDWEREQLSGFLALPAVGVLEIDEETSVRYAEIHDHLRRSGTPVTSNDLWIAASAMQHGLRLLTTDSDFQKIPHILVEYFPPTGASA
jgi:tRNA(fMet)-specific endonuclease VapC